MAHKKTAAPITPPITGYSATAKEALQESTAQVQEIHDAIAATTFGIFNHMPGIGNSTQLIQQAHNAMTDSMYAAFHQAGGDLLEITGNMEKQSNTIDPAQQLPGQLVSNLRSALNGAFGEHLAKANHLLAIPMGIYRDDRLIPLTPQALSMAWPQNTNRLGIFIHGLVCNEHCWEAAPNAVDIPRRLEAEAGYTALTLRYNTALPIVENGARLALLLNELLSVWPYPVQELIIIGHSMGGLLARSAFEQSKTTEFNWPALTRMIICLGSPNLGSSIEQLGQLSSTALRLAGMSKPHANIATPGNLDLLDEHKDTDLPRPRPPDIAWRFIGGSLTDDPDNPLGELFGDGLISLASATPHELTGNIESVRLGAVNHMGLLSEPRVYAQIIAWLKR